MCQLIPNIRGLPISEPDPPIDAVIDFDMETPQLSLREKHRFVRFNEN
jgi:hypothetical protein